MSEDSDDLYDRFVASMGTDDAGEYYDEDDLLEIFDLGSDSQDNAVRARVLEISARCYPKSDPLNLRRAVFFLEQGHPQAASRALGNVSADLPMTRLISMAIEMPVQPVAIEALEGILRDFDRMDDESVIRFVGLAHGMDLWDWMKANAEALMSHTDFPQTAAYELAQFARMREDYEYEARMADRLTALEPFNVEFWEMAAMNGIRRQLWTQALEAADYALAIDPSTPVASYCRLKAELAGMSDMRSMARIQQRLLPLIARMIEKNAEDDGRGVDYMSIHDDMLDILVQYYTNAGDEALPLLREAFKALPDEDALRHAMLVRLPDELPDELIVELVSEEAEMPMGRTPSEEALTLYQEGAYAGAIMILDGIEALRGLDASELDLRLLCLYQDSRHGQMVAEVESRMDIAPIHRIIDLNVLFCYLTLALPGGSAKAGEAREVFNDRLRDEWDEMTPFQRLSAGMMQDRLKSL